MVLLEELAALRALAIVTIPLSVAGCGSGRKQRSVRESGSWRDHGDERKAARMLSLGHWYSRKRVARQGAARDPSRL